MSDITDVNISGLDGVEQWATDITAGKILKQLEDMFKLNKQEQAKMKKMLTEMGQDRKLTKKTYEEATRTARQNKARPGGSGSTKKDPFVNKLKPDRMFGTMTSGLGDFTRNITDSSKSLQDFSKYLHISTSNLKRGFGLAAIGGLFTLFGKIIGTAITNVEKNVEMLSALNDVGIIVKDSWRGLMDVAADTGITLDKMQQVSEQFSATIGLVGLDRISKFVNKANEASGGLSKFGVSLAQAVEFQTEYLEQQRLSGVFQYHNEAKQGKLLAENIARLTDYSKALNVSRKQMLESSKSLLGSAEIQRRLSTMSADDREKASAGFGNVASAMKSLGPGFENLLPIMQDIMSYDTGLENASEGMRRLMNAGFAEAAFELQKIKQEAEQGIMHDNEEIARRIQAALPPGMTINALAMSDQFRDTANMMGALNMTGLQLAASQEELEKKALAAGMSVDDYKKSVDANTSAMTELDNAVSKLKARWNLLLTKGIMDLFGGILSGLGFGGLRDVITGASNGIDAFGVWLKGIADSGVFTNIGVSIGEALKSMKDFWDSLGDEEDEKDRGFLAKLGLFLWAGLKNVLGWAVGGIIDILKWGFGGLMRVIQDKFGFDSDAQNKQEDIDEAKLRLKRTDLTPQKRAQIEADIKKMEAEKAALEKAEMEKLGIGQPSALAQDVVQTGTAQMSGKKVAQAATPAPVSTPKVEQTEKQQPEKPKQDSIADILKTGTGDQLDMLDDIRQLMAMSTRSLETLVKKSGNGGALLQG